MKAAGPPVGECNIILVDNSGTGLPARLAAILAKHPEVVYNKNTFRARVAVRLARGFVHAV
jgi:hypothetical protein